MFVCYIKIICLVHQSLPHSPLGHEISNASPSASADIQPPQPNGAAGRLRFWRSRCRLPAPITSAALVRIADRPDDNDAAAAKDADSTSFAIAAAAVCSSGSAAAPQTVVDCRWCSLMRAEMPRTHARTHPHTLSHTRSHTQSRTPPGPPRSQLATHDTRRRVDAECVDGGVVMQRAIEMITRALRWRPPFRLVAVAVGTPGTQHGRGSRRARFWPAADTHVHARARTHYALAGGNCKMGWQRCVRFGDAAGLREHTI